MTQDIYVELFKQTKPAAEHGDMKAQSLLGAIYSEGSGVEKNYVEAVKWFKLAAAKGDASAQNYLGYAYAVGQGVVQNLLRLLSITN